MNDVSEDDGTPKVAKRPRREVVNKDKEEEVEVKVETSLSNKWTNNEVDNLLKGLKLHGHKNFQKLMEYLPYKSEKDIRNFITCATSKSRKLQPGHLVLENWIALCENETSKKNLSKFGDAIEIAQVIKYLSVDGLIENHPLPEKCGGINFASAYRLLYQMLLGYPLQPVNKATAEFVCNTITELNLEVSKNTEAIDKLKTFLMEKFSNSNLKNTSDNVNNEAVVGTSVNQENMKKPLRVYQKKRRQQEVTQEIPALSLIIQPADMEDPGSTSAQYTISMDSGNESSVINVPRVVSEIPKHKDEELASRVYQSIGYNPLQIPENWLKEFTTYRSKAASSCSSK